ncbi:MAG: radical SAM family heme chaperone HemW [Lachnospiraceae bacterium]
MIRNRHIMKPLSIYIHIPFCIKKCKYCDFLSAPADSRTQEEYLHALIQEIRAESGKYRDFEVKTVFIGGGTPTAVDPAGLCKVIKAVTSSFSMAENAEISMEANPGTVTEEALALYRHAGINRLSIGLQSADDKELQMLGRIHSYEDFLTTYSLARKAGFANINVDLMAALPGQHPEDFMRTLEKVLALCPPPEHISAYSLIVEEGTPFFALYGEEKEKMAHTGERQAHLPSEEEERQMYALTEELLQEAGYHRYEISNYSRPGYECRHNMVYWQRGDYAGFGLGAASMVGNVRFQNLSDLQSYLTAEDKVAERNTLNEKEQMEEFMFLGLRLIKGVEKEAFEHTFGIPMDAVYGKVIAENVKNGLLTDGMSVALTGRGLNLANYVMAQFLLDE